MRNFTLMLCLVTGIFGDRGAASAGRTAYGSESTSAGVSLFAPDDGGTPREVSRIAAVGQGEFRVRACAEEGHSVLTHAVSRVDLICRNDGVKAHDIVLHIDLSDDGRRTNADESPFGGMSARDFIFIQPPGQPWRQIDGTVSGWVCTVRFSAPPGETKVGLSPWYTYADYLRFIQSLPDHPHMKKTRLGVSDGGREHWELAITDPDVLPENKRTIFWHAREHAYETFSSYAIEGLVTYLLSDAAAEVRRRYQIVLHPMTNVDGVAQGYEYRSGYDYPQSRGTVTAKLTFDAIDRLRPHFVVTWHNWIAPRGVDCLFYTDSEDGKASRRAWDLFVERFPSPRVVGHRWESEADPLAKNWFGRPSLSESNVHQYAMKRYGTQVWGWEMPWWGRGEGDPTQSARKAGADFGRAFVETLDIIGAGTTALSPEKPPVTVPCWEMHEFELHGRSHVGNEKKDLGKLNDYVTSLRSHPIPVLADEFGYEDTDIVRSKMWVVFCSGAAGVGTGHHLKVFQRFLAQSRVPFQRMAPSNSLVEGGGLTRFCLTEAGHHYVVYSTSGSFTLTVHGTGLKAYWFNPWDVNSSLGTGFNTAAGTSTFTPPDSSKDWVLWVTGGMDLNSGVTHPSAGATVTQVVVSK